MILDQGEHPLDGVPGPLVVAFGAVHEPDEHGMVADDEGRDAEDVEGADGLLVLVAHHLGRPAGSRLRPARLGVDPGTAQRLADHGTVAQIAALVVPATNRDGERRGTGREAGRGPPPRRPGTRGRAWWPDPPTPGVPPSGTWAWLRKNGTKVTSQSAPASRPSRRCSWPLRANGTPIVPGHGKS